MSGLEKLPPDQRAVLQLILVQGRGYADLAGLLKLDVAAVRDRAIAGVDALGIPGADALDAAGRARIADYLLGQQDDGERIVTFAELGDSAAACRWAQELRQRLAPLAHAELPEVPAAASANGSGATTVSAPPAPVAAAPAFAPRPPAPVVGTTAPAPAAARAPPPPGEGSTPAPPGGAARSSRLGGAILIAGIAAIVIVLAIVLIGGGDDDPNSSASSTTPTQQQTTPSTQPSTTAARTPTARIVAQVNLTATPSGGQAVGLGLVQRGGRQLAIAIEAQRLPANGAQDIYAVWLQGAGGSKFLGFVPRQVRDKGSFTVSAGLPSNVRDYSTVLITREGVTAVPRAPGTAILNGALRLPA